MDHSTPTDVFVLTARRVPVARFSLDISREALTTPRAIVRAVEALQQVDGLGCRRFLPALRSTLASSS